MGATKPEVEINIERKELALAERLQRLPLNVCHALLRYGIADMTQNWPTSKTQNGDHQTESGNNH